MNAQMFSAGDFDVGDNYKLHGTTKTLKEIANGGYIRPDAKRRKFGTTIFVGVNLPMTDFPASMALY
ncbi:hypothetical protein CFP56_029222 [Quercus suber]|uniref:Uncharacterized protein n=1 Tax=Quercus suber TaxID=58331 RepID=A0AAW0ME03_QUESU